MTAGPEPAVRVRAQGIPDGRARVFVRTAAFDVDGQTPFQAGDSAPSALDLLLAALAADLVIGLGREAARAGVRLDAIEARLAGALDNPLVALGVVGETGSAALSAVTGSVWVETDAEPASVRELWDRACARAPAYVTLSRCATVRIALECMP